MNPLFHALTGGQNGPSQPFSPQMNNLASGPMNGLQSVVERARSMMQNPMQAVQQMIPGLPANIANDPNAILGWLQQTGRVNPQMMQTAQQISQMIGGR